MKDKHIRESYLVYNKCVCMYVYEVKNVYSI